MSELEKLKQELKEKDEIIQAQKMKLEKLQEKYCELENAYLVLSRYNKSNQN